MLLTFSEYQEISGIKARQTIYNKIDKKFIKSKTVGKHQFIEISLEEFNKLMEEKNGTLDMTDLKISVAKLETDKKYLVEQKEKLEKENDTLKYELRNKELDNKQLLEKMENLNDRVIGLIEWKNTSWLNKIFKRKK